MAKTAKTTAKKNVAPTGTSALKTVDKAVSPGDAPAWNTIHVFGHGQTQIIGKEANGAIPSEGLKSVGPLLEHLASLRKKGTKLSLDELHSLNILNGLFIDFRSGRDSNSHQRFGWADINPRLAEKLANEVMGVIAKAKAKNAA